MKINKDYSLKSVLDSYVIINTVKNSNYVIKLNEISKDIFENLSNNKTKEEIINILLNKYEVGKEELKKDIDEFIIELKNKGILIDE